MSKGLRDKITIDGIAYVRSAEVCRLLGWSEGSARGGGFVTTMTEAKVPKIEVSGVNYWDEASVLAYAQAREREPKPNNGASPEQLSHARAQRINERLSRIEAKLDALLDAWNVPTWGFDKSKGE